MKTLLTFVSLIAGTFAFAGGMAAGSTLDLFLLYGGIILLIFLVIFVPRGIRWIRMFLQHRTHSE